MKIAKWYRPELVVSRDLERPQLTDPYLDAKEERLVATNGHALVALPVETDKAERSRYLSCSLLKAARGLGDDEVPAQIVDQEVVEFGVLWPAAQERSFPDWQEVVPKFHRGDKGTATIHLSPRLLSAVSQAMAAGSGVALTFEVGKPEAPILVQPLTVDPMELGVLMPLRQGEEEDVEPGQKCPACGKLLAAGAPCPEHGHAKPTIVPALSAAAERVKAAAALIDGGGTTITIRSGGKEVTATPAQVRAGLDELQRRKGEAPPAVLAWKETPDVHVAIVPGGKYEVAFHGKRAALWWCPDVGAKRPLGDFAKGASARDAAKRDALKRVADAMLENAGDGALTKRDVSGPASAQKKGGRRG
jgi:hypothetical protein